MEKTTSLKKQTMSFFWALIASSPCCFVLQVMLCSIEEEGGCKIGAHTSRAGLNLGAVKMRVEQGKKVRIKEEIHILY
jgi:hypothetical protein